MAGHYLLWVRSNNPKISLSTEGKTRKYLQGHLSEFISVLVSAGIELIVFLVAGIVLCFGFSMRRMLITH